MALSRMVLHMGHIGINFHASKDKISTPQTCRTAVTRYYHDSIARDTDLTFMRIKDMISVKWSG